MRTHYCGQLGSAHVDQTVTLCGWAHRRRDHGGVIFIDLRDREGLAQIVCDPDRADMFATAETVRNEFVLRITGKVRRRPEGTTNANLASGEVEILCHELEILNAAVTPPFQLDDGRLGLAQVPVQAAHQLKAFACDAGQQMFVGGVLRAGGVGMRHPQRGHAQQLAEHIVGQ